MKKRVIVGMSGGVDSSVTAALLQEQGYDVVGVYILGWTGTPEFPCSWQQEEADARAVAEQLGIPFHTINLSKEYEEAVIKDFFSQYEQGFTPNPDILCNKEIKFKALWEAVRQFEPDYIATGHYARVEHQGPIHRLLKGVDESKDQSYFLWGISRSVLPYVLFPVGDLKKSQVRELAKKFKLPTAAKKDSQGICFVGPLKVRSFLSSYLKPKVGQALLKDGRVVGQHKGATIYTVGQRLGAGTVDWTGDVPPLFVIAKDVKTNELVVGQDSETYATALTASSLNWLEEPDTAQFACMAKIRYRQEDAPVQVKRNGSDVTVEFDHSVRALTPGQSIVFYKGDQLIGGGVIKTVPEQEEILKKLHGQKTAAKTPTTSF